VDGFGNIKILYFSKDYTPHDRRFLAALAETPHQISYLRLEQRGHTLEDRPLPPQIQMIPWKGGGGPAHLQDGPRLLADLKRVIQTVQPDLVQAGPLQTAALLVALAGYQPLVSMSWGYDLLFDADRSARWRWATRYTLGHSAVMIGDCNTIRQRARAFGMPDERIVTFPWGVDLDHFKVAQDERSSTQAFTLLSTRNWEPIYGVDVIAKAFVQAAQKCPELRLVLLGNGSQASLLRQILTRGSVMEQVHFPGQVSYSDLPRYYRSADLYISASHSDGSSISLLEAMACGRPALVSDIPGNREWVEPSVQGWLFPDGDADFLAQAILHAVDEQKRLPEMGRAAHALAEQRANWKKNFLELLKAYEIALQTR
jgi:glycosyltransferase involved in cell wall biosynthesis